MTKVNIRYTADLEDTLYEVERIYRDRFEHFINYCNKLL